MATGRERFVRSTLAVLLLAATLLWGASLIAAPYVVSHHPQDSRIFKAAVGVYLFGQVVCHQQPRRSFRMWRAQLPVCARCAGLYWSAPLGVLVALATTEWRPTARRPAGDPSLKTLLIGAAVPAVATLVVERLDIMAVAGWMRALSSLPIAVVVGWVLAAWIRGYLR